MHPAFALLAGPVHHRVPGMSERAVAGACKADPLGGPGGEIAGAAAHIARGIGDAAAGVGDAAAHIAGRVGDAVGHSGVVGDQPSRPEPDKGDRNRIGADGLDAALQQLVRVRYDRHVRSLPTGGAPAALRVERVNGFLRLRPVRACSDRAAEPGNRQSNISATAVIETAL